MADHMNLMPLLAQAEAAGYAISIAEKEDHLILTFGFIRAKVTPAQATSFLNSILRESNTASLRSMAAY